MSGIDQNHDQKIEDNFQRKLNTPIHRKLDTNLVYCIIEVMSCVL